MSSLPNLSLSSNSWTTMAREGVDLIPSHDVPIIAHQEGLEQVSVVSAPSPAAEAYLLGGATTTILHPAAGEEAGEVDEDRLSLCSSESWVELNPTEVKRRTDWLPEAPPAAAPAATAATQTASPLRELLIEAPHVDSVRPLVKEDTTPTLTTSVQEPSQVPVSGSERAHRTATPVIGESVLSTSPFHAPNSSAERPQDAVFLTEEEEEEELLRPSMLSSEGVAINEDCRLSWYEEALSMETVDVDPEESDLAAAVGSALRPGEMVGMTAMLRQRVIQEDFLHHSGEGSSDLSAAERETVIEVLFGDVGSTPISAEKFREIMVPFERHCECLGASYGFHHQGCQHFTGSALTS